MTGHGDLQRSLGSYVLGALDPAERREVDAHLTTCAECREQLSTYAVVPGLLSRLDIREVIGQTLLPPPSLLSAVLATVERARSARDRQVFRWRTAAAGLAVAATVLGAFSLANLGSPSAPPLVAGGADQVLGATGGSTANGTVSLRQRLWGTELHLRLQHLPAADGYVVYAVDAAGVRSVAARWGPTPTGAADVPGASALATERLVNVVVATVGGKDVLSLHT